MNDFIRDSILRKIIWLCVPFCTHDPAWKSQCSENVWCGKYIGKHFFNQEFFCHDVGAIQRTQQGGVHHTALGCSYVFGECVGRLYCEPAPNKTFSLSGRLDIHGDQSTSRSLRLWP